MTADTPADQNTTNTATAHHLTDPSRSKSFEQSLEQKAALFPEKNGQGLRERWRSGLRLFVCANMLVGKLNNLHGSNNTDHHRLGCKMESFLTSLLSAVDLSV